MIDLEVGRLRLASRARLRWDQHSKGHLLLWPERGMLLGDSAAEILRLCDGRRSLAEIVEALATAHPSTQAHEIARDARDFLESLVDRALLDVV